MKVYYELVLLKSKTNVNLFSNGKYINYDEKDYHLKKTNKEYTIVLLEYSASYTNMHILIIGVLTQIALQGNFKGDFPFILW